MTQEIYALAANRTATSAKAFLDRFLPNRSAFADEYPVPECSDTPTSVFTTPEDLMTYLEANPTEAYGLYWNSSEDVDPVRQAMLFYTVDSHLILGLAAAQSELRGIFDELLVFAGTGIGMFGNEERPPESASEFVALARQAPRR